MGTQLDVARVGTLDFLISIVTILIKVYKCKDLAIWSYGILINCEPIKWDSTTKPVKGSWTPAPSMLISGGGTISPVTRYYVDLYPFQCSRWFPYRRVITESTWTAYWRWITGSPRTTFVLDPSQQFIPSCEGQYISILGRLHGDGRSIQKEVSFSMNFHSKLEGSKCKNGEMYRLSLKDGNSTSQDECITKKHYLYWGNKIIISDWEPLVKKLVTG